VTTRRPDNRIVRARSRLLLLLTVTLTLFSSAADLLASAAVMACCRKTHFRCAGVKAPDDCCRSMQHGGRQNLATTRAITPIDMHPVAILPERPVLGSLVFERAPVAAFKRPHDPPHLHSFNLLV